MSAPFSGLTVLEYADFVAGPYCGKLLADLGARVIKIEPPGVGDSARKYGPFPGDTPHQEMSGLFLYLGLNKLGVTLDPATPSGKDLFIKLVSIADLLIEDTSPGSMAEMGLGHSTLCEVNPSLVQVSITPYGQDGPKAGWKAQHINSFHASGEGFTLPGGATHSMFPERAPVAAGAQLGEYDAGLMAASGAVAALYARVIWGTGQHVDVSKQEATLGLNRLMLAQAEVDGEVVDRSRHYVYGGIFACVDGYVMLYPREDRQWAALTEIMGQPGLATEERFLNRAARIQHADQVNGLISRWTADLTKQEIYGRVAPSGCPAALFATSEDVFGSPQFQARQFFESVDHPVAGKLDYPTRPFKLLSGLHYNQDAENRTQPAPLLGQHNEEIFCGELGLTSEHLSNLQRGGVV